MHTIMNPLRASLVLAATVALTASACGSHGVAPNPGIGTANSFPSALHDGSAPAAVGSLYVATTGSKVYAFAPGATVPKLVISKGIHTPDDLHFDGQNNLFVANAGPGQNGSVTVYARGQGNPTRTITSGVKGPTNGSTAVTHDGTLIVADTGGISEYHPGASTPFLSIAATSGSVALASQTSFFATTSMTVANFTIGSSSSNFHINGPFMIPGSMAVDSHGTLYVVDACGPGCAVYEFGPHGHLIRILSNGIDAPLFVLVDGSENAWVLNFGELSSSISAFHRNGTTPFEAIDHGLNSPIVIAVDGAGTLYLANDGGPAAIAEYARGSTTPTLTFRLPHNERARALVISPPGL
jgi:sugar lactone lactonase YvrE